MAEDMEREEATEDANLQKEEDMEKEEGKANMKEGTHTVDVEKKSNEGDIELEETNMDPDRNESSCATSWNHEEKYPVLGTFFPMPFGATHIVPREVDAERLSTLIDPHRKAEQEEACFFEDNVIQTSSFIFCFSSIL